MDLDDIWRLGADNLTSENPPLKLDRIILQQMVKMADASLVPNFSNYRLTRHWHVVQKYLTPEQQFLFRRRWREIFKDTWPPTNEVVD